MGEWYHEQRLQDTRFYKFISTQYTEVVPPGDVFPLLKDYPKVSKSVSEEDPDKDELIFHMVTAGLTSGTNK